VNRSASEGYNITIEDPNCLNSFQKLMCCWKTLAPYNAVQAVEISGMANRSFWQTAADHVLQALIDQKHLPRMPPLEPIEMWGNGAPPESIIVQQINRPFADGECPVRLCLVQGVDGFHLIVVYDHWLADSWSIRELMRCIYCQACTNTFTTEFDLLAGPERCPHWLPSAYHCLRQYLRHRRAARLNFADPLDFKTGMVMKVLDADVIVRVRDSARQRGVSVHDMFTTIIAQLMGARTQQNRYARRRLGHAPRDRVAIGSIVDIRKLAGQNRPTGSPGTAATPSSTGHDRHFGVLLGFTTTITQVPERTTMDDLLAVVHRQHLQQKQRLSPLASLQALEVTRFFWNLYTDKRHLAIFFSKNLPLLAGISNVNLTEQWMCRADAGQMDIRDYFRVSPVGPLLPLVWATTTFKNRLTVCLTYRQTALNGDQANRLLDDFAIQLQQWTGG